MIVEVTMNNELERALRIHWWLPEQTSFGDKPKCDNCKFFGTKNDNCLFGICGQSGWICGNWIESEEVQIKLEGL